MNKCVAAQMRATDGKFVQVSIELNSFPCKLNDTINTKIIKLV
jgi:hypothetical protein